MVSTTTTSTPFTGGPLVTAGQPCSNPGEIGHSADGEALICESSDGSDGGLSVPATAAQVAAAATPKTTTKVAGLTATRTTGSAAGAGSSLAFTGFAVLPALAFALLLLGIGTLMWARATKQELGLAMDARAAELRRLEREERDARNRARWHW